MGVGFMTDTRILNDIEGDYEACLATYENAIAAFDDLIYKKEKNKIDEKMYQARLNDVGVNLGRVGEYAYKYILKLVQLEIFPKQDYVQFTDTERIYKKSKLKQLINKRIITQENYDEICAFHDDNDQLFHNYEYLDLILKYVNPTIYTNFIKLVDYQFISDSLKDIDIKSFETSEYVDVINGKFHFIPSTISIFGMSPIIFPEVVEKIDGRIDETNDNQRLVIKYAHDQIKKLRKRGDLFTKFRYTANKKEDENLSLSEIHDINKVMFLLIEYIKAIHKYNDLYVKPEFIYGMKKSIELRTYFKRTPESVAAIFEKYGYKDTDLVLEILKSKYIINNDRDELDEVLNLCEEYGIHLDHYSLELVLDFSITPNVLKLFFDNDIYNIITIHDMIYTYDEDGLYIRSYREIEEAINRHNRFKNM